MVDPNDVQAGLVARTKAKATIVALLPSANEIREDEWQGDVFAYPNVRIKLGTMTPTVATECNKWSVAPVSFLCFSESASSKEANAIAIEIVDQFHTKNFTQSGVRFLMFCTSLIPAIRQDERTWKSEAIFKVIVEPA